MTTSILRLHHHSAVSFLASLASLATLVALASLATLAATSTASFRFKYDALVSVLALLPPLILDRSVSERVSERVP